MKKIPRARHVSYPFGQWLRPANLPLLIVGTIPLQQPYKKLTFILNKGEGGCFNGQTNVVNSATWLECSKKPYLMLCLKKVKGVTKVHDKLTTYM
jgi:hypothetical protein